MQPDGTVPPAPPPVVPGPPREPGQYDFILNPQQAPKKSLLPSGKQGRIMVVAGGAAVLLIIALLLGSILSSAGKENVENLVIAAKQQNELIRVAEIGSSKARGQAAKNIAITTKLSLQSQQAAMLDALKTQGRKLTPKDLAASQNPKTDQLLTQAEQSNKFDEVFIDTMQTSLTNYQKAVQKAYDGATSRKLKAALADQYKSANTLAGVAAETK
jgi:hypothetical protein